jgi:hypothetical protein
MVVRWGTDRGGRDEHDGGLTSGEGRRQRPESWSTPAARALTGGARPDAAAGGDASGCMAAAGARKGTGAQARGARLPCLYRRGARWARLPSLEAAAARSSFAACGWAPMGLAAERAGAGRAFGLGPF